MVLTEDQRFEAIGENASDYKCDIDQYGDGVCHPFCYQTEMMCRGWQWCVHVSIDTKQLRIERGK